jgi:hypothetical protein
LVKDSGKNVIVIYSGPTPVIGTRTRSSTVIGGHRTRSSVNDQLSLAYSFGADTIDNPLLNMYLVLYEPGRLVVPLHLDG